MVEWRASNTDFLTLLLPPLFFFTLIHMAVCSNVVLSLGLTGADVPTFNYGLLHDDTIPRIGQVRDTLRLTLVAFTTLIAIKPGNWTKEEEHGGRHQSLERAIWSFGPSF